MDKNKITSVDYEEEKQKNASNVSQDKRTKKLSNAQKAMPPLIVAVVSLAIILTCVLIAYYQVYKSSKQNANILEGVYASSYYSMVDNVNNLSVDISKFSSASTNESKIVSLQDMNQDCSYILAGLGVLPINHDNVIAATKFFNQISGVCQAYQTKLSKGSPLTNDEELLLSKVAIVLGKIKNNFNTQNMGMYDTNFNFVDAGIFDKTGMNELSAGMGDLTNSSIEYPSMIFDGPFSTALETKTVKGLGNEEYTKEQAYDYLRNTVYKNRDEVSIIFEKETNGIIPTYDFNVKIKKKSFDVQVSKKGCLVISISGYAEGGDAIMTSEQALEQSKTFANNIGFESMEHVWLEVHENVAYINLASTQGDIILYPDLVKVKVDLTSQEIIGLEAVNYALNHVDRNVEFNVLPSAAEDKLGFDYNILKETKTVIRLDHGVEIAAYEYMIEKMDGIYFYYIDANTGSIAKIMKLVSVKGVEKLI